MPSAAGMQGGPLTDCVLRGWNPPGTAGYLLLLMYVA